VNWIPVDKVSLTAESPPHIPGVLTTSDGGSLLQALEEFFRSSQDGDLLRIMSPIVDDEQIVRLLVEARRRGVSVRLLTTLSDRNGIKTKGWDAAQDIDQHDECIRQLAKAGVILRSPLTTPHGKFIVHNNLRAIFGSANLARGSLRGKALEAGLIFEESAVVRSLAESYDRVWKASPFRLRHKEGVIILEEGSAESLTDSINSGTTDTADFGVWLSGPGCPLGTKRLVDLVRQAQMELFLVTMSLYGTDEIPDFHEAVLGALARGVRVRAVVRPEHFTIDKYPDSATAELIRHGMELRGLTGLHAKGFLIDKKFCGIQSANFNPYSLDSQRAEANWETAIVGSAQTPMLRDFAAFIERMALNPTHQLVY
jgi:phosphatidylserine/phosphatidylglycerophosphate/cardiolipin synthase-like enzyme